jgi:hypothetical protein
LLRAGHANGVPFLERIGWVRDTPSPSSRRPSGDRGGRSSSYVGARGSSMRSSPGSSTAATRRGPTSRGASRTPRRPRMPDGYGRSTTSSAP